MAEKAEENTRLSVTVKYKDVKGKGYDMPWVVFHGTVDTIRRDIVQFFGFEDVEVKNEDGTDLPLHALVLNANTYAHQLQGVTQTLGATVTAVQTGVKSGGWSEEKPTAWDQATPQEAAGAAQTAAQPEGSVYPYQDLEDALRAATDAYTLRRIWANNREGFADQKWGERLKAAYKETGKSLAN